MFLSGTPTARLQRRRDTAMFRFDRVWKLSSRALHLPLELLV